MKPQIDKLYIYRQKNTNFMLGAFKNINVRHNKIDFRFMRGNIPDIANDIYRYAKTVEINGVKRTLLMITLDDNKTNANKFFIASKKVISQDGELLKKFVEANSKPINIDIHYDY